MNPPWNGLEIRDPPLSLQDITTDNKDVRAYLTPFYVQDIRTDEENEKTHLPPLYLQDAMTGDKDLKAHLSPNRTYKAEGQVTGM